MKCYNEEFAVTVIKITIDRVYCIMWKVLWSYHMIYRDCIQGVGWDILKNAFEILGRIEEDEVEVMVYIYQC